MLLIHTHRRGFEADPVIDELARRGEPFFRFNVDDPRALIDFDPSGARIDLVCDGRRICASGLRAGWFQQDLPSIGFREGLSRAEVLQALSRAAAHQVLLEQPHLAWLTSPEAARRAANKPLQLLAAVAAGFKIPSTRITNDPAAVRLFAESSGKIVVKNLATPWILSEDRTELAYTQDFEGKRFTDEEIAFAPLVYQEKVRRQRDIRAVFVDGEVFAAAIDSRGLTDIRRIPLADADYLPIQLAPDVEDAVRELCSELGLGFASIDLAEDAAGDLLFFEVNVTGAFLWLERTCGFPITSAIVAALLARNEGA